jgi:LmbE family N-acetylglucosaminyl deacetylase
MSDHIQLDVLAIFSHPDDAELTMAGTLLKLKSLGYRTGIADMTRGEMGTRGTPEIRAKEALDAARVLRLDARVNLGLPDGHLAHIVREAARLATMKRYDKDSGMNAIKMPAIAHAVYSRLVVPSFIVDVSEFAEKKMEAIRAYASQFYLADSKEPETRIAQKGFLRQIEDRARYYGSLIGVEDGEPFYVREALNVDDPVALLTRPMNIYS